MSATLLREAASLMRQRAGRIADAGERFAAIMSWTNPALALALADLLERQAAFIDAGGDVADAGAGGDETALAVARAYLGRDS